MPNLIFVRELYEADSSTICVLCCSNLICLNCPFPESFSLKL